tara:strand:- start:495 stop:761 length:267 start_codon:yes stop_codon:yes gene_type:complete
MIADCVKPSSFPRKEEVLVNIQKEENMDELKTFNITIKCQSETERDIILEKVLTDPDTSHFVHCNPTSNVFFSENDGKHFMDEEREVN